MRAGCSTPAHRGLGEHFSRHRVSVDPLLVAPLSLKPCSFIENTKPSHSLTMKTIPHVSAERRFHPCDSCTGRDLSSVINGVLPSLPQPATGLAGGRRSLLYQE